VNRVEGFLNREATQISGSIGGFYLTRAQTTCENIQNFSLAQVVSVVEKDGPILLRLLSATAMTPKMRTESANILAAQAGSEPLLAYFSRPLAFGSGNSRRDLWVVSWL
jgi:hypothetical protein